MTGGGFEVEPDDLVAHASHVDSLVDRLNTAISAAGSAMSTEAYGLLCAFLPPIVNPTGEKAKDALSASVEGVHGLSENVRAAAKTYREGEEANADPFKRQLAAAPNGDEPAMSRVDGSERLTARTMATAPLLAREGVRE